MPTRTGPRLKPRLLDSRQYEQALRQIILRPMVADMERRLDRAWQAWEAIEAEIARAGTSPATLAGATAEEAAAANLKRVSDWHKIRFERQMSRFLGVRVSLFEGEQMSRFMAGRIKENVDLIKTIEGRFHAGLKDRIQMIQKEGPFDQQALRKIFSKEYQPTRKTQSIIRTGKGEVRALVQASEREQAWNIRRLTRDQTNKTVGRLNQIRQTAVGIEEYDWEDAGDIKVRPTHAENGRIKRFNWNNPPATGHPGEEILCRCSALPVVHF